jgi:GNAT superfamily N-acetyltransferase
MLNAEFSVRHAVVDDSEGILACLHAAFEPYQSQYTPLAYEDTVLTAASLEHRLQDMSVLVAVLPAGEVIGTIAYSMVNAAEGHLRGMAVRPEHQGRGVASALLQRTEAELRNRGCRRITLDTTEPLQRAARFYRRHGFRSSGRVSDFYGMTLCEFVKPLE